MYTKQLSMINVVCPAKTHVLIKIKMFLNKHGKTFIERKKSIWYSHTANFPREKCFLHFSVILSDILFTKKCVYIKFYVNDRYFIIYEICKFFTIKGNIWKLNPESWIFNCRCIGCVIG